MNVSGNRGEQLELAFDPDKLAWAELHRLSEKERELSKQLDNFREQLQKHAREMKRAKIATVAQIATELHRTRPNVHGWMREGQKVRAVESLDDDPDWVDPEGHLPH